MQSARGEGSPGWEGALLETTASLAALWLGFAATHMGLSSVRLRPRLVARLGERGFQAAYSLVALALFVPLVWVYATHKHAGPWLWSLPHGPWLLAVAYLGNGLALVLLISGFVQPSPVVRKDAPSEARGLLRLTRHPTFMAIGLWAATHLLPNGSAADVAFFGGMLGFALVGAWHQDRRKLATGSPGFREFYEATAFLRLGGAQALRGLRELPPGVVLGGLAATVALRYFHRALFGP
ncbi:MAG: NnrU family protein [Myxococcota bacterium]